MEGKIADSVFRLTDELHDDVDGIYESIVDEDGNASNLIDGLITKLKSLKSNLNRTDEV